MRTLKLSAFASQVPGLKACVIIPRLLLFLSVFLPWLGIFSPWEFPSIWFVHCYLLYRFPIFVQWLFILLLTYGLSEAFVITSKPAVSIVWHDSKHTFAHFPWGIVLETNFLDHGQCGNWTVPMGAMLFLKCLCHCELPLSDQQSSLALTLLACWFLPDN